MKTVGIFGTSGFARETGDICHALGIKPVYVTHNKSEVSSWEFDDQIIHENEAEKFKDMGFTVGIGENLIRQKIMLKFANRVKFVNIIHPDASLGLQQAEKLNRSTGIIICAGARFTNNISVGNFCIFNLNCTIGHDCIVEDFVNVAPGANISGNVHIGSFSWIGTGAAVNQGKFDDKLRIGRNTTVGSGSVVTKSCDENAVYAGIPARRIK